MLPHGPRTRGPALAARDRWREVMKLATRQAGRVSRDQLRHLGFTRSALRVAVAEHRLIPLPGGMIFLVGHAHQAPAAMLWTGLLAGGTGSVISHEAGIGTWRLLPMPRGRVDVISPTRWTTNVPGVTIHQNRLDPRRDITHRHGLPVTTLLTTIVHFASVASEGRLAAAVQTAATRGQLHAANVERLVAMSRRRAGGALLREVLAGRDRSTGATKGSLERAFASLARRAGLPPYERGVHVDLGRGELIECDVVWRAYRVMVEIDFLPQHETGFVPFRDRRRDRRLAAAGWTIIRVSDVDLERHPDEVVEDILAALRLGGHRLAPAA